MFKVILNRQANDLAGSYSARIPPHSSWENLKPNFLLDASERSKKYSIELLSICRGEEPGLARDHGHAWVRLIEPSGEVYSVGFYPDESTSVEPDEVPGLRMPGMLLSPDKYEKHHQRGWNCRSVKYPISEMCFRQTKAVIEHMQANRLNGSLAFDLCEYNCVYFVMKIAALCGICVRGKTSLSQLTDDLFLYSSLQRSTSKLSRLVPQCLSSRVNHSVYIIRSVFFNMALALLGGFATLSIQWQKNSADQITQSYIKQLEPVFLSYKQLFYKRVPFYHVREFRKWQLDVNQESARHV
jgi:hypothetical protein